MTKDASGDEAEYRVGSSTDPSSLCPENEVAATGDNALVTQCANVLEMTIDENVQGVPPSHEAEQDSHPGFLMPAVGGQSHVPPLRESFILPMDLWESDSSTDSCKICGSFFSVTRRRHHCRRCGSLVCAQCICLAQIPAFHIDFDINALDPSYSIPKFCSTCFAAVFQRIPSPSSTQGDIRSFRPQFPDRRLIRSLWGERSEKVLPLTLLSPSPVIPAAPTPPPGLAYYAPSVGIGELTRAVDFACAVSSRLHPAMQSSLIRTLSDAVLFELQRAGCLLIPPDRSTLLDLIHIHTEKGDYSVQSRPDTLVFRGQPVWISASQLGSPLLYLSTHSITESSVSRVCTLASSAHKRSMVLLSCGQISPVAINRLCSCGMKVVCISQVSPATIARLSLTTGASTGCGGILRLGRISSFSLQGTVSSVVLHSRESYPVSELKSTEVMRPPPPQSSLLPTPFSILLTCPSHGDTLRQEAKQVLSQLLDLTLLNLLNKESSSTLQELEGDVALLVSVQFGAAQCVSRVPISVNGDLGLLSAQQFMHQEHHLVIADVLGALLSIGRTCPHVVADGLCPRCQYPLDMHTLVFENHQGRVAFHTEKSTESDVKEPVLTVDGTTLWRQVLLYLSLSSFISLAVRSANKRVHFSWGTQQVVVNASGPRPLTLCYVGSAYSSLQRALSQPLSVPDDTKDMTTSGCPQIRGALSQVVASIRQSFRKTFSELSKFSDGIEENARTRLLQRCIEAPYSVLELRHVVQPSISSFAHIIIEILDSGGQVQSLPILEDFSWKDTGLMRLLLHQHSSRLSSAEILHYEESRTALSAVGLTFRDVAASLAISSSWQPHGGKSSSIFYYSDLAIAKCIRVNEAKVLQRILPELLADAPQSPLLPQWLILVSIVIGRDTIQDEDAYSTLTTSGRQFYFLISPNIRFCDGRDNYCFDIKGTSVRSSPIRDLAWSVLNDQHAEENPRLAHLISQGRATRMSTRDSTLLDSDILSLHSWIPLLCPESFRTLNSQLEVALSIMERYGLIDYSLLVQISESSGTLIAGIIDIGQDYSQIKRVESALKVTKTILTFQRMRQPQPVSLSEEGSAHSTLFADGGICPNRMPTIMPPQIYAERLLNFALRALTPVPARDVYVTFNTTAEQVNHDIFRQSCAIASNLFSITAKDSVVDAGADDSSMTPMSNLGQVRGGLASFEASVTVLSNGTPCDCPVCQWLQAFSAVREGMPPPWPLVDTSNYPICQYSR